MQLPGFARPRLDFDDAMPSFLGWGSRGPEMTRLANQGWWAPKSQAVSSLAFMRLCGVLYSVHVHWQHGVPLRHNQQVDRGGSQLSVILLSSTLGGRIPTRHLGGSTTPLRQQRLLLLLLVAMLSLKPGGHESLSWLHRCFVGVVGKIVRDVDRIFGHWSPKSPNRYRLSKHVFLYSDLLCDFFRL